MKNPKLFMLMVGCKPPGRYTEQHDTLFTIAEDFLGTEKDARTFWPDAEKIHIDAYREVTNVEGYKITVVPKGQEKKSDRKLFFINLGGYKPDVFDEFHYKLLVVAKDMSEAHKIAKRSAFCIHHPGPTKNALPHIDDAYGVAVDDSYEVIDILPPHVKEQYSIEIENILFLERVPEDTVSIGYQRYEKFKKSEG